MRLQTGLSLRSTIRMGFLPTHSLGTFKQSRDIYILDDSMWRYCVFAKRKWISCISIIVLVVCCPKVWTMWRECAYVFVFEWHEPVYVMYLEKENEKWKKSGICSWLESLTNGFTRDSYTGNGWWWWNCLSIALSLSLSLSLKPLTQRFVDSFSFLVLLGE